jgi:transcription elongation GreA/GreB family factor
MMTKKYLIDKCKAEIIAKKEAIEEEMENLKISLGAETKSSAGDKYETSREMMNQEKGKLQSQMAVLNQQLETLSKINASFKHEKIGLGSVVKTSASNYFISISYGKVSDGKQDVFMISAITPLAQQMINKKVGEEVVWNGKSILIEEIE